uniref:Zgc:85777 n=1 Tax=Oncorhynchus kisutch TaxID=8019 RepID=A0A8C7MAK9_ONCKI
ISSTRKLIGNVSSKSKAASGSLEHFARKVSLKSYEREINPYVDQWVGVCVYVCCAEYGGIGLDFSYSIAVSEELGNIRCGGIPMAIGVQTDMATPALARFGSEELKKEFLLPSIMGDKVACLGVSEVGAGSDVASKFPKAVSLSHTSGGPSHKNKSLICLPMNSPGVHIARTIDKTGMSSDTAKVFFDDVRVPCNNLIGEIKKLIKKMLQFQEERLWAVGNIVTMRDNIIQDTIQYTRQRKIFKMSVLYHQSVHFRLAELETEIELLHSLHRWVMLSIICKYMDTLPKAPDKN